MVPCKIKLYGTDKSPFCLDNITGSYGSFWRTRRDLETIRRHPASPTALCDPLISGEFLCPLLLEVFVILCHQAKFTSDGTLTSFNVIGFLSNHPFHLQYGFIIVII